MTEREAELDKWLKRSEKAYAMTRLYEDAYDLDRYWKWSWAYLKLVKKADEYRKKL